MLHVASKAGALDLPLPRDLPSELSEDGESMAGRPPEALPRTSAENGLQLFLWFPGVDILGPFVLFFCGYVLRFGLSSSDWFGLFWELVAGT